MNTVVYECGCSITYSMFGDKEIIDAHMCQEHQNEYSSLIELTARVIREIHS